jgi:peptidoglycan/LPS O-acetylase OafA/YrhL
MTVLALGTSLVIAAASQSSWRAPRLFAPILSLGRHSYEIYLTHIFVVLALFQIFVRLGKPMHAVPVLFLASIILAGAAGWLVASLYTEPLNRWIRRKHKDSATLASATVKA